MRSRLAGCLLGFIPFFIAGCSGNRLEVDVSDSDLNLAVTRFDQTLFQTPVEQLSEANRNFIEQYPVFYRDYVESVINVGMVNDPALPSGLKSFVTYPDVKEISAMVADVYSDLGAIDQEFTMAFRYFQHHFPDKKIPKLISYISGLNAGIMVGDEYLGIGLDWYLGEECPYYLAKGFPLYQIRQQTKEFIVRDALSLWVQTEYPYSDKKQTMLKQMVYQGKVLYLLDAFFPNHSDQWKIGYSEAQLQWCKDNEFNMWGHWVDNKYLFSTKLDIIRQFTGGGPFTTDFSKDSPSRTGVWMGWKIVRQFMERNSDVSLKALMTIDDPQEILSRSGYRP